MDSKALNFEILKSVKDNSYKIVKLPMYCDKFTEKQLNLIEIEHEMELFDANYEYFLEILVKKEDFLNFLRLILKI